MLIYLRNSTPGHGGGRTHTMHNSISVGDSVIAMGGCGRATSRRHSALRLQDDMFIAQHPWRCGAGSASSPYLNKQRDIYQFSTTMLGGCSIRPTADRDRGNWRLSGDPRRRSWSGRCYYGIADTSMRMLSSVHISAGTTPTPRSRSAFAVRGQRAVHVEYMGRARRVMPARAGCGVDFKAVAYRWSQDVMSQLFLPIPSNSKPAEPFAPTRWSSHRLHS